MTHTMIQTNYKNAIFKFLIKFNINAVTHEKQMT